MKGFLTAVSVGVLASGCATTMSEQELAAVRERAALVPTCASPIECDEMWGRAISWVMTNSAYRMQMQTDNVIQTFGPTPNSSYPAYAVSLQPLGDGRYQINFRAGCDNMFGCNPDTLVAQARFNSAVAGEN